MCNYSDPFGLCPPDNLACDVIKVVATVGAGELGALAGAALGAGEGLACGPGAPACSPIAGGAQAEILGSAAALAAGNWVDQQFMKPSSPGKMQREVEKGQAPGSVDRVDRGNPSDPGDLEPHIHFKDGSALKQSGIWKHGGHALTKAEQQWITGHNWNLPPTGGGGTTW
jgi:hypothetical protein